MTKEFFIDTYIVSYLVRYTIEETVSTKHIQEAHKKALIAWDSYWSYIYTK